MVFMSSSIGMFVYMLITSIEKGIACDGILCMSWIRFSSCAESFR